MAGLRPFRGLRYTQAAGDLDSLLAPPTGTLTPDERNKFANRSAHNALALAAPEGHGDDRSKFVRYARGAARLAEWRREGFLALEERPAFYRLTQRFGPERRTRTTLFAVASPDDLTLVEAVDPRAREDRLRLLEATQTAFEPAVAFYDDPDGRILAAVKAAPGMMEAGSKLDGLEGTLEPIGDPGAIEALRRTFEGVTLLVADGSDAIEANREFPGSKGVLVALASRGDSFARLPVHRVVRRLPGGREAVLARLAETCEIEEHLNRNLIVHMDRAHDVGRPAFGMATEGGRGYLLTPRHPLDTPAPIWLHDQVFGPVFNLSESDPTLSFTDPIQAVRVADEGAAAAFLLPKPLGDELGETRRLGLRLPPHTARTYTAIPVGIVLWPMGDEG